MLLLWNGVQNNPKQKTVRKHKLARNEEFISILNISVHFNLPFYTFNKSMNDF